MAGQTAKSSREAPERPIFGGCVSLTGELAIWRLAPRGPGPGRPGRPAGLRPVDLRAGLPMLYAAIWPEVEARGPRHKAGGHTEGPPEKEPPLGALGRGAHHLDGLPSYLGTFGHEGV